MKTRTAVSTLQRIYRYLKPYKSQVVLALVLMLGIDGFTVLIPQMVRLSIDKGVQAANLSVLGFGVAAILLLSLLKGVFTYFQGRLVETYSQSVAYDVREELHRRLTNLSFSFHDQSENGQLLSRAIQDVERIRFLTGRASQRIVEGAVLLVGTAAVMIVMSPTLALVSLIPMPFLVHRAFRYGATIRPLSFRIQQQLAVLTTRVEQSLRGARVVKSFAQEESQAELFRNENDHWFELSRESSRVQAVNGPLMNFISNLSTVVIIGYGGYLIVGGKLTFGVLVAFLTYLGQLVQPVRLMGQIAPVVGMAISSGERVFEVVDARSEVVEAGDAYELPRIEGEVRFDHVSFAYAGRETVLRDIDFTVRPGQIVALLGATGSGKSTIMNLIPRFYDVTAGRLTLDGHDVRSVTLSSLREQIGIVMQESVLFGTTIRENIRLGWPEATDEQVVAAAEAAQAHEFIAAAEKGYDTTIGEMGVTLSGGQKQRVAIARALLKDPRVLLLDDATSSVDTATEQRIQQALSTLMKGRTSFVIAQRLSTVRMADFIIVMEDGKIAAAGRHDELLVRSNLYAEICREQLVSAEAQSVQVENETETAAGDPR